MQFYVQDISTISEILCYNVLPTYQSSDIFLQHVDRHLYNEQDPHNYPHGYSVLLKFSKQHVFTGIAMPKTGLQY